MQVGGHSPAGSELHTWRNFLARATLGLGVVLLGSGVICWVAANWPALDKTERFAGAQAVLALCALAAAWIGLRLRADADTRRHVAGAVLTLAGLMLGALLALVGQTYQTGADTWELFAVWAVLLLPWALAAASQPVWLLWAIVVNLAASLWLGEQLFVWWVAFAGPGFPSLVMAGLNLLLLAGWELAARHWRAGTRVGPRVLAALALGVLVLGLLVGDVILGLGTYTGVAWAAATVALGLYYYSVRRDLVILAMLAAGIIFVSLRIVGEWLLRLEPGVWVALPLAALLMGEAVLAARWLRKLAAATPGRLPADPEPAGASAGNPVDPAADTAPVIALADGAVLARPETPWYIHGLLGLSAWLATLLLLLFLAVSGLIGSPELGLVAGLVLCTAAIAVLRNASAPFWRQCAVALGFTGQILIAYGLYDVSSSIGGTWLLVLAMGILVYVLAPDALLRFLSGWMMALAGACLVWWSMLPGLAGNIDLLDAMMDYDVSVASIVWQPVAVLGAWAAAAAFWIGHRLAPPRQRRLDPLGWSLAIAVQGLVWMSGGVAAPHLFMLWSARPSTAAFSVAGALLPAVVAALVLGARRAALTAALVWTVPLALLVLALFWLPSPGIAFALAWMLLGVGLNKPRLAIFGVLALLSYLLIYYYQLEVPLLQKAGWLATAGLLMFLLRGMVWLVPRVMRTTTAAPFVMAPATGPQRWRAAGVLAGLLLALGAANTAIWQREDLLASGRVAILELAPVDPRSLMQGDYMALRFAAGNDINRLHDAAMEALPEEQDSRFVRTDGYVVLTPDEQGVAQVARVQEAAQPRQDNELVLRYRLRPDGVRIVTNAYFFPEGQAEHFANARYGEVRLDDSGTGLLVRMLDEKRQPLQALGPERPPEETDVP
ncbi:GDYXXLXY domain-containing protein [Bordetella genomosp. 13]|uniref:GDYXXLXY domain-containing protein n=1 Tax=Bordetella genomosp. 13 TaxID=463040 RepID=UPI0011A0D2E9|nr:GDYXXLXY domain-containing protein [Bordetella genomosp. 13]